MNALLIARLTFLPVITSFLTALTFYWSLTPIAVISSGILISLVCVLGPRHVSIWQLLMIGTASLLAPAAGALGGFYTTQSILQLLGRHSGMMLVLLNCVFMFLIFWMVVSVGIFLAFRPRLPRWIFPAMLGLAFLACLTTTWVMVPVDGFRSISRIWPVQVITFFSLSIPLTFFMTMLHVHKAQLANRLMSVSDSSVSDSEIPATSTQLT